MKLPIMIITILILLWGCASFDKTFIDNPVNRQALEPLDLDMGYEPYHLRLDLIRNTENPPLAASDDKPKNNNTSFTNVSYHYLVLKFGNGIMLDYNRNLFVDLPSFYQLDQKKNYKILQQPTGFGNIDMLFSKKGTTFTRKDSHLLGNKTEVVFQENKVTINEGFLRTKFEILTTADSVFITSGGFFGFLGDAKIIKLSEDKYELPGLAKDTIFEQVNPSTIRMDKILEVTQAENLITFKYAGFFGRDNVYHFIKTANGFVFYDEKYRGIEVSRVGNTINYSENKVVTSTFIIQEES
jgi:hypothetical protein